jgi:hypothetical protein
MWHHVDVLTDVSEERIAVCNCLQLFSLSLRLRIFLFFLLPWRWRRFVPPKRRLTQHLHGATSQTTAFFMKNTVHNLVQIALKDSRALGVGGHSDCVEGSWRDWNLARWYPRLVKMDEGDPGFQLLRKEGIVAVLFFIYFLQQYLYYYIFHLFVVYFFPLWFFLRH